MPFNKIKPGDRLTEFPAGTWNSLVDAVRPGGSFTTKPGRDKAGPIKWKNSAGSDAPWGAIIRFTGGMDLDNASEPALIGAQPNTTLQQIYGISLGPVAAGSCGDCTIFDPSRAYYLDSDGTPAYGETWGPVDGQWYLRKWRPGFFIFGNHKGSGTSARVTAVHLPISTLLGKADSNIDALSGATPGSGTVSVYYWNGTSLADSTFNITAYNLSTSSIASAKYLQLKSIYGLWWVDFEACS